MPRTLSFVEFGEGEARHPSPLDPKFVTFSMLATGGCYMVDILRCRNVLSDCGAI
jgi:hypothetical protein